MVAIWALTLLIAGSVVFLALQDPTFSKPLVHVNLLTDTNATYSLYVHFVTLALIFITAIMDYILLVKNRNNRCRTDSLCYSLSRKYQIKENIVVMSLIWPLDMWYAAVFSVYYIGSCYIRLVRANLSVAQFVANYDVLYMLLPMHSIVTLLLYLRFVKKCKSKRANDAIAESENPAKLYFEQLRSQWGRYLLTIIMCDGRKANYGQSSEFCYNNLDGAAYG
ncbi:serpentine type 7TM GPCR receptor class ab chemoreceptor domain-containing protein [Ditylenchus destructor]|uniref:Serpentine type 7TM GPCR receptor class ab chemoreceptor domain-containing protein n=1 Tax=Ditylenchus destructor TaxID=166010 RepID=A0AAD4R506_9BILA|nr:serpentine type 7TM GPCR receptor class ab chemoreceptor domain-containing protein [Ditylenchus destructor]